AIVAASNAGGAGSVIGDTTTTIMWISGVHPSAVLDAYIASSAAFLVFAIIASVQQDRYRAIAKDNIPSRKIDGVRIIIVVLILAGTITANLLFDYPAIGVWFVLAATAWKRKISWLEVRRSLKGSVFLVSLVLAASLLPVEQLPEPSVKSTFYLGFISAV